MENQSLYDFNVKTIDGENISLSEFKNQVLLIVNVASRCGFTPQYAGLETLYQHYKEKGFSVLGFPCNQFGKQESGSENEIKQFCELNYHVSFPLFAKIEVNGKNANPLYVYLRKQQPGILGSTAIKWNFTKFLINRQGEVIKRYASATKPEDIEADIANLLDK